MSSSRFSRPLTEVKDSKGAPAPGNAGYQARNKGAKDAPIFVRVSDLEKLVLKGLPAGVLDHYDIVMRSGAQDNGAFRIVLVPIMTPIQPGLPISELRQFGGTIPLIRQLKESAVEKVSEADLKDKLFNSLKDAKVVNVATKNEAIQLIGMSDRLEKSRKNLSLFKKQGDDGHFERVKKAAEGQIIRAGHLLREAENVVREGLTPDFSKLTKQFGCVAWFFDRFVRNEFNIKPSESLVRYFFPKDIMKGIRLKIDEFGSDETRMQAGKFTDKISWLWATWIRHGSISEGKATFVLPPPYSMVESLKLSTISRESPPVVEIEGPLGPMNREYNLVIFYLRGYVPFNIQPIDFWRGIGFTDIKDPSPETGDFRQQAIAEATAKRMNFANFSLMITIMTLQRNPREVLEKKLLDREVKERDDVEFNLGAFLVAESKIPTEMEDIDPLKAFPGETREDKKRAYDQAVFNWFNDRKDITVKKKKREFFQRIPKSQLTDDGAKLLKILQDSKENAQFKDEVQQFLVSFKSTVLQKLAAKTIRWAITVYDIDEMASSPDRPDGDMGYYRPTGNQPVEVEQLY